jgi:hypothetical protein
MAHAVAVSSGLFGGAGAIVGGVVGGVGGGAGGSVVPLMGTAAGGTTGAIAGAGALGEAGTYVGISVGTGVGLISCMSSSGSGGGYRDKTTGANARDRKMIGDAAREVGVNRRDFGDYVEHVKPDYGKGPSDTFSFKQLLELARQFKKGGL